MWGFGSHSLLSERGSVQDEKNFQKRVQQIGGLVAELETIADPATRTACKTLVQLLMDLYGTSLERVMEVVFKKGEVGEQIIAELGRDPLVSSMLVLYGLHPDDLETRVVRQLENLRPQLRKNSCEVELIGLEHGNARLRVQLDKHGCGSTKKTIQTLIEGSLYDAAPDLNSLVVEGFEDPAASGFVSLDTLAASFPAPASSSMALNGQGTD